MNGPSSLNIVIAPISGSGPGVGTQQEPSPTSSLSSSGVSTFSSNGSTSPGNNVDVQAEKLSTEKASVGAGNTYSSRLSLRGKSIESSKTSFGYSPRKLGMLSTPVQKRSLEDNYGAVVAANHQALAQLLDQVHSSLHQTLSCFPSS